MTRTHRLTPAKRLIVHMVVYFVAFTMVLPFVWMVVTSLKTSAEAMAAQLTLIPHGPPWKWQWWHYVEAVRSANLDRYYLNSIGVAVITTVLAVAHNALAGFAFAKLRFRGKRVLFGLTLATMMLPLQVYFIFAYLVTGQLGFVDNWQALIVPFLASGFGIYYMRQAVTTVPDSLIEAGRIDGMTDIELFWNIVRPSIWPAMSALGIFTFINSWNSFFWPLIVSDSDASKTLPLAVAELAAGRFVQSWPVRMAAGVILTVPLIVVFVVFQRAFVRGVTLTGLKE